LKTALTILAVVVLGALAGCNGAVAQKELFAVDFQKGRTLRYRFVSSRDINVDWGSAEKMSKKAKSRTDKFRESIDIVVAYTPIEVDPYGVTSIRATCESVKVKRSKGPQKDAVESLAGKSFTFTVDPAGRIKDYSQLEQLIKEAGEKAFIRSRKNSRVKELDMICDFTATQWFLWDSISSIEKPVEGVSVGQSWKSRLFIPAPMVMRKARDVTYTLDEIRETPKGRLAVIRSSYSPAKSAPSSWPMPYTGTFQMKGMFGFLRGYEILELQGQGEELFNMDRGRAEQYNQQYRMKLIGALPLPLPGAAPRINIGQKLTMRFLGSR
jgi:hypothetical protein